MAKPILAGYDPATADRAPVEFGLAAARLTGAPLIAAAVEVAEDCTELLAELKGDVGDTPVECRRLTGATAERALHEAAEAEGAGLIVVGSARRGPVGRITHGSTAAHLIPGAPCPVAVTPRGWHARGELRIIGVGYVDSDEAREALRGAHALARRAGAKLRVITAVEPGAWRYAETEPRTPVRPGKDVTAVEGEARVQAEQHARAAVAALARDVTAEVDAFIGDPAEVLIELSERLDLLVCGARGYGPLRAVMLGSVSRRVAGEARCPVIVLPRGVTAALEDLVAEPAGAATP